MDRVHGPDVLSKSQPQDIRRGQAELRASRSLSEPVMHATVCAVTLSRAHRVQTHLPLTNCSSPGNLSACGLCFKADHQLLLFSAQFCASDTIGAAYNNRWSGEIWLSSQW